MHAGTRMSAYDRRVHDPDLIDDMQASGAQNDLQQATDMVRHMVAQYGITDTLAQALLEKEAIDRAGLDALLHTRGVQAIRQTRG